MYTKYELLRSLSENSAEVSADWTEEGFEALERERYKSDALMAIAASLIPRRLGADASADDLRRDKRVSRQVAQLYLDLYSRVWGRTNDYWREAKIRAEHSSSARRAGATVQWESWIEGRIFWVPQHQSQLAVFALRENLVDWGARWASLFLAELRGLKRASSGLR